MSDTQKALLAKIRGAVEDGLHLRVVTVVGDITATQPIADTKARWVVRGTQVDGAADPAIETRMDLIDGDIRTAIHEKFVTDEKYRPVLQMHTDREKLAQQRLEKNLELVKQLYKFVREELEPTEDPPPTPANTTTAAT